MAASWHIGRGLRVLVQHEQGVELEGTCRLAPGRVVMLFGMAPAPSRGRPAYVTTWRLLRAGRDGLIYRGSCEWVDAPGKPIPMHTATTEDRAR